MSGIWCVCASRREDLVCAHKWIFLVEPIRHTQIQYAYTPPECMKEDITGTHLPVCTLYFGIVYMVIMSEELSSCPPHSHFIASVRRHEVGCVFVRNHGGHAPHRAAAIRGHAKLRNLRSGLDIVVPTRDSVCVPDGIGRLSV